MSNNRLSLRNSRTRSTSSFQQIPEDQLIPNDDQKVHELKDDNLNQNTDNQAQKSNENISNVTSDNRQWNGFLNLGTELLENKGSVARDHMANERTFLSWIRTSMGLATCGVGIAQLFKLNTETGHKGNEFLRKIGKPVGASFILIAIICVIMGLFRFFSTQSLLKQEKYPAARLSVTILVFLVLAVSIVTLVSVLYVNSTSFD